MAGKVAYLFDRLPEPAPARDDVRQVFERWQALTGHARARLDAVRRRVIEARLADGYSVQDLELALYGCRFSAFHQGENDRAEVYDGLTLILRDAEHVDRFCAIADRVLARMQARAEAEHAAAAAPPAERDASGAGYREFLDAAVRLGVRVRGRRA